MKKVMLALILVLLSSVCFAQSIEIESITGKVLYQSSDVWNFVTPDVLLVQNTVISTGINSKLVLLIDEKHFIIGAMKKGTIKSLLFENRITLNSKITNSNIDSKDIQNRVSENTASTRASEATNDIEWQ